MISLSYCGTTTSMREAARDSGMEVVGAMRTDSSHRKNVKRCVVLIYQPDQNLSMAFGQHVPLGEEEGGHFQLVFFFLIEALGKCPSTVPFHALIDTQPREESLCT